MRKHGLRESLGNPRVKYLGTGLSFDSDMWDKYGYPILSPDPFNKTLASSRSGNPPGTVPGGSCQRGRPTQADGKNLFSVKEKVNTVSGFSATALRGERLIRRPQRPAPPGGRPHAPGGG